MAVALAASTQVKNTAFAPDPVLQVPRPAGIAIGALLLVEIWSHAAAANFGSDTVPSGWSPLAPTTTTAGSEPIKSILYWKLATSTEVANATYTFTRGTTSSVNAFSATGTLAMINGADLTTPINVTPTVNITADNSASLTFAAITPTVGDTLIAYFGAQFVLTGATNGASWPTIGPSGTTVSTGAKINDGAIIAGIASKTQAAIATVASTSVAINNHNDGAHIGFTVAIAPAVVAVYPFRRDLSYYLEQ